MVGTEAEIHTSEAREALQEETCAGGKNQGQGDVGHDQAAMPAMTAPGSGATGTLFERLGKPGACSLPRRNHSEDQAGENGHADGEGQNGEVEPRGRKSPDGRRQGPGDERGSPGGEEESQSTAQQREQTAFGEQLPNDAHAAGSQGSAQGDLFLA